MKEPITFVGDKQLWIEFTIKLKRERKTVWEVLSVLLESYTAGDTPAPHRKKVESDTLKDDIDTEQLSYNSIITS